MMLWIEFLSLLVVWLTAWSLIRRDEWWFRFADFPRLQILATGFLVLPFLLFYDAAWHYWRITIVIGLLIALAYQLKMVLPYTLLWRKQVQTVQPEHINTDQQISLLVSNVLTPNKKYHKLIQHIQRLQPDVILTLETDSVWQQVLQVIEADYPYRVAVPLDNLYGMHLYSRLKLSNSQVKYLFSDDIPSIHTQVQLRSGQWIDLYGLHPRPPSPTEARESTLRDAELLLVGDAIKDINQSTIVMGDLNDVAWSRTTRLFQRISGLLDPRVGRHFINTFHADYPMFRWSLDHVFHSTDFGLVTMQRLSHIGSDHFPVYTVLQSSRHFEREQEPLVQTAEDEQLAAEKIQEGIEKSELK